jgi:UDP-sulfoquinovose synthase
MQGVVFGTRIDEMVGDPRLFSRLDFDQCFGTVINRFCCQAVIGHPLTLYGAGNQKRGFLPLRDSMLCLAIAVENPPSAGEYRVFNQFDECYTVSELATLVRDAAESLSLEVEIEHYANPRDEPEQHYYNPDREKLVQLGYVPSNNIATELQMMLADLSAYRQRIQDHAHVLVPDIRWDGTRQRSQIMQGDQVL